MEAGCPCKLEKKVKIKEKKTFPELSRIEKEEEEEKKQHSLHLC